MSEQDNLATVRGAYDAFQRGDIPAILATLTDDAQWELPGPPGMAHAGRRQGPEGAAEFFRLLSQAEDVEVFEPREYVAQGDKVIVLGRYRAHLKATGGIVDIDWVQVFSFRGSRVSGWREYYDTYSVAPAYAQAEALQHHDARAV